MSDEFSLEHEMERWDYFHKDESKGITNEALQRLAQAEREALRRVAANSSLADAVLLAGSLGHPDLFTERK